MSKGEIAKVKSLYQKLGANENGIVPLSSVTKLSHFRKNVLAQLVASHYARVVDAGNDTEESVHSQEDVIDLGKFIEFFDVLSPKKDSSAKVKGTSYIAD